MKPLQLRHTDIRIQAERAWLDALLSFAPDVRGLLICAAPYIGHLRDSRDNYAAGILRDAGFGTLIVSMLTPYEETRDPDVRYDVTLLGNRLQALLTWIDQQPDLAGLPLGLLATGTVVGASIRHLAREPERISALVSRAGRADLAGAEPLRRLSIPILMQVPGDARDLQKPSVQAYAHLGGPKQWHEISNASASFIEPGALESITREACEWFIRYLPTRQSPTTVASEPIA
ncbi:MAG: putative phosphoribosyltransferase [Proteobacteria bacterium]|nr:putative phosphoribosyltransferase [Pseudomonadota bacterium]